MSLLKKQLGEVQLEAVRCHDLELSTSTLQQEVASLVMVLGGRVYNQLLPAESQETVTARNQAATPLRIIMQHGAAIKGRIIWRTGRCDSINVIPPGLQLRFAFHLQDFIGFDRAEFFIDPNHQGQSNRGGGHADHDRGQDEHVREGIAVDNVLSPLDKDRGGATAHLRHRDVEQDDRGLEDAEAHHLLDQVVPCNEDVEADHQEDPVWLRVAQKSGRPIHQL